MAIIGIDLGTTNSLAVVYRNGKVEMIPNQFNEYLTPSVVSFEDNQLIVGKIAKERLVTHADVTAQLFKRDMGTSKTFTLGKQSFLPEELSAFVVKQLVEDAKVYLQEEIEELVISVPAYFNAKQRRATKEVGKILGIKVERLINEPSAAAIACRHSEAFETFVVFDFGGGTLDTSVVDCFNNVISICSIAGENYLGGSDFDLTIAEYFCQENNFQFSLLSESKQKSLLLNAERVKIGLQTENNVTMKARIEEQEYSLEFTRELLKKITMPIFQKIKRVIAKVVKESGFDVDEFSHFILVGGSSHMPIIKDYLTDLIKIPVVANGEIDLLVAQGLGKYIGIKQRDETIKHLVVTDICPFSLTTAVYNELDATNPLSHTIIPKNSVLPASKTRSLVTRGEYQKVVDISVYQGESMYVKDSLFLGEFTIKLPKNIKKEHFDVTYSYDINSMLYIEVTLGSNKEVYTFNIGDGKNLEIVRDKNHLKSIKEVSLKLDKEPEIELLLQKAGRLYEESDDQTREFIKENISMFKKVTDQTSNNLQKKDKIIDQFDSLLNRIEKNNTWEQSDLFKDSNLIDSSAGDEFLS